MKKIILFLCIATAVELSAQPNPTKPSQEKTVRLGRAEGTKPDHGNRCDRGQRWHFPELLDKEWLNREAIAELDAKEREAFNSMVTEHNLAIKPLRSEYQLRAAELRYLADAKSPDMKQIEKKLDEIGELEKKMQLEKIAFKHKILSNFPSLDKDMTIPK